MQKYELWFYIKTMFVSSFYTLEYFLIDHEVEKPKHVK